jgi:two-component system response regulator PilR (NtrC family)
MVQKCALIVDDEPDIRELLEITLGRMDIQTHSAANIKTARALLAEQPFDFCLTDMKLPDGNGIELVEHIQSSFPNTPIAMITAHGNMESAVEALKAGAFDFVSKPVNLELLRQLVDTALNLEPLDTTTAEQTDEHKLLGQSDIIAGLRKQITKLARSQAPVYISGESGSGKELVARLLHRLGPHGDAPFIPVNCGAIPTELMESEFFGHIKGSFTGATTDKQGLFQAASGGTLFLDEVADLPLAMQVKLLRGIQEKAIRPIGAQTEIAVDVRIVSATHKDLAAEVAANRFRQDLYYRINVIELKVPSLRERQHDIPELAVYLLKRVEKGYNQPATEISPEAMAALQRHHFPGNVRELENILERAFALCEEGIIYPHDLSLTPAVDVAEKAPQTTAEDTTAVSGDKSPDDVDSLESYLEDIEKNVIVEALEATRWNKTAAAKKLGITFRALRYRLKKLDLE